MSGKTPYSIPPHTPVDTHPWIGMIYLRLTHEVPFKFLLQHTLTFPCFSVNQPLQSLVHGISTVKSTRNLSVTFKMYTFRSFPYVPSKIEGDVLRRIDQCMYS